MNLAMGTRNTANLPDRQEKCTEFQFYSGKNRKNTIDFTEYKLVCYAQKTKDLQQKLMLMTMIEDYRKGLIAIAWKRGVPVYFRVTRDT